VINKNHLREVNLTYFSHLKFTLGEVIRLLGMSVVMLVHGLIPWIWYDKYSSYVNEAKMRIQMITQEPERKK
tara:strand:+ start:99 stop:314 length:216 start_codon:yes stop_codon:yes gene_type:complete